MRPTARFPPPRIVVILSHRIRVLERLDNLVREVALHATKEEAVDVEQLLHAVHLGYVQPADAHASLVALRHAQREAA